MTEQCVRRSCGRNGMRRPPPLEAQGPHVLVPAKAHLTVDLARGAPFWRRHVVLALPASFLRTLYDR